jgi:hypothetical protein
MSDLDLPAASPSEISSVHPEENQGEISPVCPTENTHEILEKSFFVGEPLGPDRPLLIRLDPLLLSAIEGERIRNPTPDCLIEPRTRTIRTLLREALDVRQALRDQSATETAPDASAGPE